MKSVIPLETICRLLAHLAPQVDDLCDGRNGVVSEEEIISFLRDTTLVGLLPVPHPIVIRKYQANKFTRSWFTSYMWGVIFLRNQKFPLFDGSAIKLFTVATI